MGLQVGRKSLFVAQILQIHRPFFFFFRLTASGAGLSLPLSVIYPTSAAVGISGYVLKPYMQIYR